MHNLPISPLPNFRFNGAIYRPACKGTRIVLDRELARTYAYARFLTKAEMATLLQGLVPNRQDWGEDNFPRLAEFDHELERLQADIHRGALPKLCRPQEFLAWARRLDIYLASDFAPSNISPFPTAAVPIVVNPKAGKEPKRVRETDRNEVRRIAQKIWQREPYLPLETMIKRDELHHHACRWHGHDTLRGWLRDLNPNRRKPGRPRRR